MFSWLANPGWSYLGYHTGGLLLLSAILMPFMWTRKSLVTSVFMCLGFGAALGFLAYATEHWAQKEDRAIIFGTGFAAGVALFWIRYFTSQVFKFRRWIAIVVNIVALPPVVMLAGYLRASALAYNHAADDFIRGLIQSAPFNSDKIIESLLVRQPKLGQDIIDEVRRANIAMGDDSLHASQLIQAIALRQVRTALADAFRSGSDETIRAVFVAQTETLIELQKKDDNACAAQIDGGLAPEVLVGLIGAARLERYNLLVSDVVRSEQAYPSHAIEDWVAAVWRNMPPDTLSEVNSISGTQKWVDCAREVIWRRAWQSYPEREKSEIARAFLHSTLSQP